LYNGIEEFDDSRIQTHIDLFVLNEGGRALEVALGHE
jgi:hypothetical protein